MLQRFIRAFMRVVTNAFFRRIDIVGADNVPEDGPVIFAGNHPNALMDGWLLTEKCGRWPVHFMGNAKLWKYRLLAPLLNASGAVPVYSREEHGEDADNTHAFDKLYEVIEKGDCMGVFPEGVSHAASQLTKLKTGTARIALAVAARGKTDVTIVPCGLNYIHRHRFGSQVLIEFGQPIIVNDDWAYRYSADERGTVLELTDLLAESLRAVTVNAPDWALLRFAQTTRRLYKPATAKLTPAQYIELNRRFISGYEDMKDDEELLAFRKAAENYQAQLDLLGIRDHQLRSELSLSEATSKIMARSLRMLMLLPLAIPGLLLHAPVAWIAMIVGERFSYEMDDIATLKVFATVLLLPLMYLVAAVLVGNYFGTGWGLVTFVLLCMSVFASARVVTAETTLLLSMVSIVRLARLRHDVERLRAQRAELVEQVRDLVDRRTDPSVERIFTSDDFAKPSD